MGCSESKCYNQKATPQQRVHDYQKESRHFRRDVKIQPNSLLPESFCGGYISAYQFYNQFHAGFCAPYICNPNYMLIVDFRSLEEYTESHVWTALHHSFIRWDMSTIKDLQRYSYIVFYDHDGTSAANVYSHISAIFSNLTAAMTDVSVILGGIDRVKLHFPHLVRDEGKNSVETIKNGVIRNGKTSQNNYEASSVPWMPCSVLGASIFLGNLDQARNPTVIKDLGITHIVSIGRSPEWKSKSVEYIGLDGDRNLYVTFLKSCEFIRAAIEKGGRVLVHGIEGLNRSAAVLMAFLMSMSNCLLEDAFVYMKSLRPHLMLDEETLTCLVRWETSLFGMPMTDIDELWTTDI